MEKTVLITGGATGIGGCLTENLADLGYNVIITYNKSEKEATMLNEKYKNVDIYKANLSVIDEASNLVKYILDKYNKIDILINNAGIDYVGLFTETSYEKWKEIMDVNLNSVFCITKEVCKNMISNKSGCIINISSVWGIVGASCEVAYSVSKAGIDAMTKSLAKELGPSNIRVNSIAPGIIDTKMNDNLTKDEIKQIIEEIPLKRIGRTADVYNVVKWLIEDEYTTGQIISTNGGWVI